MESSVAPAAATTAPAETSSSRLRALQAPDPAAGTRVVALGAAVICLAVAGGLLLAWLLGRGEDTVLWLGTRMKTNTAFSLTALAAALLVSAWARPRMRLRAGFTLVALAILLATLIEYSTGLNLGIDELIANDSRRLPEAVNFPNRMSPNAVLSLTMLACALLFTERRNHVRRALLGQALAIAVLALSILALVGYLYESSVLYQPTRYVRISPYTAACAATLAIGILALRPDLGLSRLMVSRGSGGYLVRPLTVLAIVAPVLFGWLHLLGERAGLYGTATGTSLLVLLTMGTFVAVVLVLARSLERVDVWRRQAETDLRLSAELTAALARAATVDEVVDVTLRLGVPALGAAAGAVMLLSEDQQELRMASARGYAGESLAPYKSIAASADLPLSIAVRTQQPVFISSVDEYQKLFPNLLRDTAGRYRAWAALPVQGREGIIGVLGLSFATAHKFGEADRERFGALAWQCGQALDRALLFDAHQKAREREQRARESAEAANRAKDEFMAMLGHELRNPLSPILTALHLMKMRADGSHVKERAIIERQLHHMVRLVDDLLDVSRITRGKVELQRKWVELGEIVAKAVEVASPLFEERKHRLRVDVDPALAVLGDEHRLTQVLSNLLTNAAKYTEPGGTITVTGKADAQSAEAIVSVKDTGIGIAADLVPRVFDLFVQGYRTPERSAGGLGLGLAIVRMLVEMHGGRVVARSEGPGHGSEFAITLPLAAAIAGTGGQVSPTVTTELAAVGTLSVRRRILVVDDNRDAAELLAEALTMEGHDVRLAFDGPTALAAAENFCPNIAFLDIGLPVMDGYELARRLRAQCPPPLLLVAITGYGQAADRVRSTEAGFDEHLVKPLDLDVALAWVKNATPSGNATVNLAG